MSYALHEKVTATDFNQYLTEIIKNYATGEGDRGFGQPFLNLTAVTTGQKISAEQWAKLASMVAICGQQTGTPITGLISNPATDEPIKIGAPVQPMIALIDASRLTASATARTIYPAVTSIVQANSWNGVLEATFNVDFGSEDAARYFFNSGGEVRINLTHPNGTDNLNNSFRTLLQDAIGTVVIDSKSVRTVSSTQSTSKPDSGYYNMTLVEQVLVSRANTGTNYSVGAIDNVKILCKRGNSTGVNGGNGASFIIRIALQCMGDASGSVLASGMTFVVDINKADKFLTGIATPNVASTGFTLTSPGNTGSSTPPGTQTPGTPGRAQYPAGGTQIFIVPQYSTLTCDLSGAGGSEGSSLGVQPRASNAKPLFAPEGVNGKNATIAELNLLAYGGHGGGVYRLSQQLPAIPGAPGGAESGDVNTLGGGAVGGKDRYKDNLTWFNGGAGGNGGRCVRTYVRGSLGAPSPGQSLTVVTPDGGYADDLQPPSGTGASYDFYPGNPGAVGVVNITWTNTTAGSVSWNTPGTYPFTVPDYTTLVFQLSGGGGGQAGLPTEMYQGYGNNPGGAVLVAQYPGTPGTNGGIATVAGVSGWENRAFGGNGGNNIPLGAAGFDTTKGNDGIKFGGDPDSQGYGGGAAGGTKGYLRTFAFDHPRDGSSGGDGALVKRTFVRGANGSPVPGQVLQCTVPAGGTPGLQYGTDRVVSSYGQDGWITINWS